MDRSESWTAERRGPVLGESGFRGILIGAALFGSLCDVGRQTTSAAEPSAHASSQLLATPVRFTDLVQLLEDPSYQVRLEAINYLEAHLIARVFQQLDEISESHGRGEKLRGCRCSTQSRPLR